MTPWYREPWPWALMAAPAAAVLGGAVTIWLAFATADGLVADDYYRRGLAINRVLAREEAARRLGVRAEVERAGGRLRVRLAGDAPEALFAHLAHATRAGYDARLRLARTAEGVYEAPLADLAPGRWRLVLEDPQGRWRIAIEEGL
ncbi:MAG: FixH family protein [Burkholderiales bacterium]|nr:FixH family protein [Burkholderiales bacterium]